MENGATLRNVVIGNERRGRHSRLTTAPYIDNMYWMNVGEDAMTDQVFGNDERCSNIEGYDADDKFFQVNAASTLNVSNCIIHRAGQGPAPERRHHVSDQRHHSIAATSTTMGEGVFRTDSSSSTARLTNSRLHDAGTVCIGPWASCTQSGNSSY